MMYPQSGYFLVYHTVPALGFQTHGFQKCFSSYERGKWDLKIENTRKYPLCGYILDVLKHTTAWDHHVGGNETLK